MRKSKPLVLIACEFSGRVRDAFIAAGCDAVSCDLLPTESPGPHIQEGVESHLDDGYDLMIAFPPCTYLCSSGLHWNKRRPGRADQTNEALDFVKMLMNANIPRIAIENPIGCISTRIRKPDQVIQPWQFGHRESKATCLWLKGLPKLTPTNVLTATRVRCGRVNPPPIVTNPSGPHLLRNWIRHIPVWDNQTASGQNKLGPSKDRAKIRSRTYQGIADAMAARWAPLLLNERS